MTIADMINDDEALPDKDAAKEFYNRYEPKEILGKGISSTVRRCIEKETGKEFAVKIIDLTVESEGDDYQTEALREETKREMHILKLCGEHKNIIELHDTFESSTFIFLVMEMCRKGELFDYLTEVVSLSEKRTRLVMRQLLEAVAFCHDLNIVHRDLKPENILLDDELNIKLSDFGFATEIEDDEELLDLCGTPGYLAPETLKVSMFEDAPGYGREVDMWACGVIMYTLLSGSPPFWHRKQMYMLRAIMDGNYNFSSPEWEDISEYPKDLISRLLIVDPKERINATEALLHPFFKRDELEVKRQFKPKRIFKAAAFSVIATHRIQRMYHNPPPISMDALRIDPYGNKNFRKVIDAAAFRMYGHWVKKGDNQNRAALFENVPKKDLKSSDSFSGFECHSYREFLEVQVQGRMNRNMQKRSGVSAR